MCQLFVDKFVLIDKSALLVTVYYFFTSQLFIIILTLYVPVGLISHRAFMVEIKIGDPLLQVIYWQTCILTDKNALWVLKSLFFLCISCVIYMHKALNKNPAN